MEHHANGAMAFRTIACLPALTGAWRERGGGLLHLTFNLFDGVLNRTDFDVADRVEDKTIRSINMVQIGRALTDPKLDPPIRALVVYNSNPAVIAPSQNLVFEGLRREDLLTVVVEQFLTDTARFADYVFPATSQLEHLDLLTSWGQDFLSLNQPAVPPQGEAVPNSEFFRRLSRRMGFSEPYLYESDEDLVKTLLRSKHPYLGGVTYEQLRERGWVRLALPEPWLPFAKGGFPTPSGKCEFFSKGLEARGVDPLPTYVPLPDDARKQPRARTFPLALLTTKSTLHFNNSSHGGEPRPRKAEGEPRIQIHAEDAAPAEHPGRRHGARLQRPGLGTDDGEGRGRDAAGRRLAAPRLLAEPPPGRLLRERPHPGRPERPRRRRRLPRRARRGGALELRPLLEEVVDREGPGSRASLVTPEPARPAREALRLTDRPPRAVALESTPCPSNPGPTSEPTRSSRPSARGAWARCGARPTPGSGATSR